MIRELAAALVLVAPPAPPPPMALPELAPLPPAPRCVHLSLGSVAELRLCALLTPDGVLIAGDGRILRAHGNALAELSHTHKHLEYGGALS